MKKILGLDLGTNSIGWAIIQKNDEKSKILGAGSRIIPMDQGDIGKFESGNTVSKTADRTHYRGIRRLRERQLLRRERLHRVLNIIGFLPEHYASNIDFVNRKGQFLENCEPKIAYSKDPNGKFEFLFKESFEQMLNNFKETQPDSSENKIPYDWTIYFLRKKALSQKIEKEELAWILLNFNQKRGYYQLRGEDDEEHQKNEYVIQLKVSEVVERENDKKNPSRKWYDIKLENGWVYQATFSMKPDWIGYEKEFLITEELDENRNVKLSKEGLPKRRLSVLPSFEEIDLMSQADKDKIYKKIKAKTEAVINNSGKTVGSYIYDALLTNPKQKIRGKLVRTIERKFYKSELITIIEKQKQYHKELSSKELLLKCVNELYPSNKAYAVTLEKSDFVKLFVEDILFYQRPLKSKKSLISNCPYEYRTYINPETSQKERVYIKCIAKSNPLYQEFRLWQFIHNLRIYERVREVDGKTISDFDVTSEFLQGEDDYVRLFDYLNECKSIKQETLLQKFFNVKKPRGASELPFRWNYVEDKEFPANETRSMIMNRFEKLRNFNSDFLDAAKLYHLWHILYSIEDKEESIKALTKFSERYSLGEDFVELFKKFPPLKKEYGAYSEKAIKKLLPLMRRGRYWDESQICKDAIYRINQVKERLGSINYEYEKIESVVDDDIPGQILKSFLKTSEYSKGLNTYQACYAVYGRHSEVSDVRRWKTPDDIEHYLKSEFKQHSLRNPIVEQIVAETLRVVKDIWVKWGDIHEIHLEMGREMKNTADERKRLSRVVSENEIRNQRIKAFLYELSNLSDVENVRPHSPMQQEILKIFEDGVLNSGIDIPEDIQKISKSPQPTQSEFTKYKLWLEQKYRSPYTGQMIPLSKLFTTDYQIEHIIPQSRFFDDAISNKVICESEVNALKGNQLGYEFIKKNENSIVELAFGKTVRIFNIAEYEDFVKQHFKNNKTKMKKLLMEDIPEKFIERQLNDTRYISNVVRSLLSNVVREEGEMEATAKNLIVCSGGVTNRLKNDWGLNDVWNNIIYPRFERLNELTQSNQFGNWVNKEGKRYFQIEMPLELQKGFSKKRIDHRHHALDALVIACATRDHINYLNNEHAKQSHQKFRYDLQRKLCRMEEVEFVRKIDGKEERIKKIVAKEFLKPWETFTEDVQKTIESIVVSFKQNLRVINKCTNYYEKIQDGKKVKIKQVKGDSWAIRKPLT
jgi:CRISPR-associated endonuclease Csn1